MGMLVEGHWQEGEKWPTDPQGRFVRGKAAFRCAVGTDAFPVEAGRYHLLLARACPWCHRTAIVRSLLGLEEAISISYVDPLMREGGWKFSETHPDDLLGTAFVHEWYTRVEPAFTGRVTVPILWDKVSETIVCNESSEIVRMLNGAFRPLATRPEIDLYPAPLQADIEHINGLVYTAVNNGVYKCGFATAQGAYEEAATALFAALDELDGILEKRVHLAGDRLTEADVRLFVTGIRFDAAYYGHFKCNLRHWADYPNLAGWMRRLWEIPAFRDTTDFAEIKRHYYASHRNINPSGIVPIGPASLV